MQAAYSLPEFSATVAEIIRQEAPTKTVESSTLRRLIGLSFDTELGVCLYTYPNPATPITAHVIYRHLTPEHLARLRQARPLPVSFAHEVAEQFMKSSAHWQLPLTVNKAMHNEIQESIEQPTPTQRAFLQQHKVVDYFQITAIESPDTLLLGSCLLQDDCERDVAKFAHQFLETLAPCSTELEKIVGVYLAQVSVFSFCGLFGVLNYDDINRDSVQKFSAFYRQNEAKMRKILALSVPFDQKIVDRMLHVANCRYCAKPPEPRTGAIPRDDSRSGG